MKEKALKILGISGSLRKKGNTDILIDAALKAAEEVGVETEKIYLSDYKFKDCIGCQKCGDSFRCVIKDGMQQIYDLLEAADAIVLGSPTYFYNVTGLTKTFLDRLYPYDAFDEEDRSVWLSMNELRGIKYAATIAVCEQETTADMGYTSVAMDQALSAVGYRVVESVKVLKLFEKGEAKHDREAIRQAERAGEKLAKTLLLAKRWKKKLKTV